MCLGESYTNFVVRATADLPRLPKWQILREMREVSHMWVLLGGASMLFISPPHSN